MTVALLVVLLYLIFQLLSTALPGRSTRNFSSMAKRGRNGNRKSNWTSKRRNMDARDANAPKIPIGNEDFNAYYKAQGVVPEQEWEEFLAILVDPLPIAFRMNQFHSITPILVKTLKERFPALFAEAQTELEQLLVEQKARVSAANSAAAAGAEAGEGMVDDGRVAQPHTTLKVLGPNGELRQERQLPSKISLPESLPWYPQEAGWHVSLARRDLRRVPQLKAFHEWLKLFTETGAISRQEVVSMIPPLLLGVQPHHMVLDMCAAPGSKTAQLLEALHGEHAKGGPAPTGAVVANDSNPRRSYMLSHRLRPHLSHALITLCNDARMLPNVFVAKGVGNLSPHVAAALLPGASEGEPDAVSRIQAALASADAHHAMMAELGKTDAAGGAGGKHGMFDRVLCDAPCSGDGTLRKAAEVWKSWSPRNGAVLGPLQVAIARRGLRLLRPGGYMVYSTCTFNPIENEAVVAQLLRDNGGRVKLVDASALLPALKRRPGISTWKVFDSDMNEFATHAEAAAAGERAEALRAAKGAANHAKRRRKAADFDVGVAKGTVQPDEGKDAVAAKPLDEAQQAVDAATAEEEAKDAALAAVQAQGGLASLSAGKLQSFFWPPTAEEAADMHLERCLRLLPHDANTGGFFVALLHKEEAAATAAAAPAAVDAAAPAAAAAGAGAAADTAAADDEDDDEGAEMAAEAPASAEDSAAMAAASAASGGADLKGLQEGSKRRRGGPDTTQVHFVPLPQADFEDLRRAYGLRDDFPRRRLWCRTLSDRVVHYVSEASAALLSMPNAGSRFKFVNVGIPMFDTKLNRANRRQRLALDSADGDASTPAAEDAEAADATPSPAPEAEADELDADGFYPETRRVGGVRRITNESAQYLLPYMSRRVIAVGLRVFLYLLRMGVGEFLPMNVLPASLRAVVDGMGVGAIVVVCDPEKAKAGNAVAEADAKQGADATDKEGVWGTVHGLDPRTVDPTFTIVVWRNASTVNVLLRREDRDGHLLRLVLAGRVQPTAAERERFVLDTVMPASAVGGPEPAASQNQPAAAAAAAAASAQ